MSYKLTQTDTVIRLSDGAFIPSDPDNVDRQRYLQWVGEGNTPQPADDPVSQVPQTVTRFQALAALHLAGHLEAVKAIMASPETSMIAKLAWDNALSFERSSQTLQSLASTLGLTDADLDALFTTAAGIEA